MYSAGYILPLLIDSRFVTGGLRHEEMFLAVGWCSRLIIAVIGFFRLSTKQEY
jgi:hypothetical protein